MRTLEYQSPLAARSRISRFLLWSPVVAGVLSAASGLFGLCHAIASTYWMAPTHYPPGTIYFPSPAAIVFGILFLAMSFVGGLWGFLGGLGVHWHPAASDADRRKAKAAMVLGALGIASMIGAFLVA